MESNYFALSYFQFWFCSNFVQMGSCPCSEIQSFYSWFFLFWCCSGGCWCRCPVVPSWVVFHIPWPRSSMACADLQPPNLHSPSLSSFGDLFNVVSLLLTPNFPQKQLQVIRNQERHFNHKILTSQESLFVFGPFLPFFLFPPWRPLSVFMWCPHNTSGF